MTDQTPHQQIRALVMYNLDDAAIARKVNWKHKIRVKPDRVADIRRFYLWKASQ